MYEIQSHNNIKMTYAAKTNIWSAFNLITEITKVTKVLLYLQPSYLLSLVYLSTKFWIIMKDSRLYSHNQSTLLCAWRMLSYLMDRKLSDNVKDFIYVFVLVEFLVDTKCYHHNMRRDERKCEHNIWFSTSSKKNDPSC